MDIDTAPVASHESDTDDAECDINSCGGTYVLYDGDRVCRRCGHLSGTGGTHDMDYRERHLTMEWREFERQRNSDSYSGWYGPDRIKFVGGFVGAYDFEDDFESE